MDMKTLSCTACAFILVTALARPSSADSYLRPEWEVGQGEVTPSDLRVEALPEAPSELTIQQAVAAALRHNFGFRRTVQQLLQAQSAWSVARQRWDLELFGRAMRTANDETVNSRQLGATLSYSASTGALISVSTELDRLDSDQSEQTAQASLRQPLLAGAGRASTAYEELRRARSSYRAALLSFFLQQQSLIERVISSYFGAVEQQQLVDIQDSSVERAKVAVKESERREQEGLEIKLDVMRARLHLAREEAAAVSQRQRMQDSLDSLLVLLGMQIGGSPDLTTVVAYEPSELDPGALIAKAMELHPELQLERLGIEDRQAALRVRRSFRLPSLDLLGGWRRTANGVEEHDWNLGLELTVPIASRSLRESVRQAEWDLLVAERELEDLKQQIIAEVRAQVRTADAARANVDIATQSVDLSRQSLQQAQRLVEEGLRTNRDLLDAQNDLTASAMSEVSSKINYYLATVRLRRAVGLDVAENLPTGTKAPPAEQAEQGAGA